MRFFDHDISLTKIAWTAAALVTTTLAVAPRADAFHMDDFNRRFNEFGRDVENGMDQHRQDMQSYFMQRHNRINRQINDRYDYLENTRARFENHHRRNMNNMLANHGFPTL